MLDNFNYSVGLYSKALLITEISAWAKKKEEEGFVPTIELLLEDIKGEEKINLSEPH